LRADSSSAYVFHLEVKIILRNCLSVFLFSQKKKY
jgi:hypothetical protein